MSFVIPPIPAVTIPVAGGNGQFPVRRIYCVGRNYAAHVREMGMDPSREPPFFFCKPTDAIVAAPAGAGAQISYPPATGQFHFEIELVAAIGRAGRNIPVEQAHEHIWGYAVGIDMTRRDLQIAARDRGRPWEPGKGFDQSAPVSLLHPASETGHPATGEIWLQVDGQDRQRSDLDKLIWSVPEIIANLSTLFALQPGDLVFTGTPEGVGPVRSGEVMRGGVAGLTDVEVRVA
ncbi:MULTISPECIES: fumarylacetoacetate hydrolase family protein [unclassified Cupriavidus]|uniref:fumarylacetoacetate hydrolase family protein n=1 Tax=unclassified Cupriavidus TaxID=2640874 RepID=UPI000405F702|nr:MULTISPECIES: fumarylacetoacetate hydrolase family protein [unclassified Cupriavidus]MBP0630269.1 fumarylacetoacetate hydrolase family protein [Cupriavidus sp. AcVe19-1a]MBP0634086.1 fumarylacetoacetate hydrolase family protein [Cupriavidus sp. AcVe19-6a]